MIRDALVTVAAALGYDKLERLKQGINSIEEYVIRSGIEGSMRGTSALLFFPGKFYEISPFGTKISQVIGRKEKDPVNFILAYPALDEKYLRRLFTGIELLVFKVCHLQLENQRRDYHFETEKLRTRIRRMKILLNVPDWDHYLAIFDELWFVRDAFAHSFMDIDQIEYCNVPLRVCFEHPKQSTTRVFMDDVRSFFEPIFLQFHTDQLSQVDSDKLFRFCDQAIKRRALAR
jgi:hypothetical protein